VGEQLHRFGLARDRLSAAVCETAGLAPRELQALEELEEDGPMTQRELADRLRLSSGGMTLLVDRLERAGLVTRRPHPSDRRAVRLQLGEGAAAAGGAPLERYHAAITAAAKRLSPDEREAAAAFLAAAAAAAARAADEAISQGGAGRVTIGLHRAKTGRSRPQRGLHVR